MIDSAIFVEKLQKAYAGHIAVRSLTFEVGRGEIFGLLGPNGAGKTTTIRILMDIIKPDAGTVRVLGEPPGKARQRVGYLPEERGLYRSMRVEECLHYLGELKGLPTRQAKQRTRELLERVGLSDWSRHKVEELSRGMQQKVQIIASLLHDPELIILDEPFQGLDPVNVDMVRGLIRELAEAGKTVVLSAHEMSLVEMLCQRIALIHQGEAVLYGPLAEIKRQFSPNALEIHPPQSLEGWPEVLRTELQDGQQTVYLHEESDPRAFLQKMLKEGMVVEQFKAASASLDQIFVAVVTGKNGRS
ncbi:MAG: ABC transporter ATP-binding protein [Ardenticatenales bacterium]|nr:ABC transporter ATP-binding protein [Ardenticatenales bacterium]